MKNKGEILASILKDFTNCCFFLHNTRELSVAEKIMDGGFIFEDQLSHSTDWVNPNDPVEIAYFLIQRKEYGPYTIIIAMPRITYENYSAVSVKLDKSIEEVMTISKPYYGDNDELIFTLSPAHILGYFNTTTNEFIQNRKWDPFYNNCRIKNRTRRT